MDKKVLVLASSPRKGGNSDLLCDSLILGAKESGNTVEKIYLQDLNIGSCRACYGYRSTGRCVQEDDMKKMIEADVIVLVTPVYFYSMDGQMKMMIDRTLPRYTETVIKILFSSLLPPLRYRLWNVQWTVCESFTDCLPGAKVGR